MKIADIKPYFGERNVAVQFSTPIILFTDAGEEVTLTERFRKLQAVGTDKGQLMTLLFIPQCKLGPVKDGANGVTIQFRADPKAQMLEWAVDADLIMAVVSFPKVSD